MSFLGDVLYALRHSSHGWAPVVTQLRRRVAVGHVLVAWLLAPVAMIVGWHLGIGGPPEWRQTVALFLWFLPPVLAIGVTIVWFERRGA
jgi:hypothetical protein